MQLQFKFELIFGLQYIIKQQQAIKEIYILNNSNHLQDVGPEIWTSLSSLEENVLPVALVIARVILNVIVRQMHLNVR